MTSINVEPKDLHDRNTLWNQEVFKISKFLRNRIWTSHKFSNAHFILREERLLHAFFPDKRTFLEMEKIHFPGPLQAKDSYSLCESRLRTATNASLDIMWAHKRIFEHTMESHLHLGSPSIMYQGRQGGFINPQRDEQMVITRLC